MKVLNILVLLLVFLLSITVGILYLAGMGVERTILNPDFFDRLISDQEIPKHLNTMIREMRELPLELEEDEGEEMPPAIAKVLMGGLADALSIDFLDHNLRIVVRDVLGFVRGDQPALAAVIDLEGAKERLRDGFVSGLEELPEEDKQMFMDDMDGAPAMSCDEIADMMLAEIDIPDSLNLAEMADEVLTPEHLETIAQFQTYRGYALVIPYLVLGVCLVLCLLLAGIAGGLKWFGLAALVAGTAVATGLTLAMTFIVVPFLAAPDLAQELPLDPGILLGVVEYTVGEMRTIPIIYAVAGLALIVGGVVLKMTLRKPAASSG